MTIVDYKAAGVDIAAGNEAVKRIKPLVEKTFTPPVKTQVGAFGSCFDLKSLLNEYDHPLLVQSIDGVGTKIKVAKMMNQFDTIGIDLVSATANDILVMGAKPLTLLDYIASDKLKPEIIEQILVGMSKACCEQQIALVGGETAEMPDTYLDGEHDLVGIVTGVVEQDKMITGQSIKSGDLVFGVQSSGLHTNGYSLARKLFFDVAGLDVDSYHPELQKTVGEALLEPHINYAHPILHSLKEGVDIKGMAHITGGGFIDNIPRILPANCAVEIKAASWEPLPIFSVMQQLGRLDNFEMYRTFNMGIGLVVVVDPASADALTEAFKLFPSFQLSCIGFVYEQNESSVRIV
ncbi:phosphoribosylformylglycinamidine cyclo-ligase [Legionella sp. W05-934-2]|uniref:phosphoribosylformylglycinamidine cyclo-ligase n=1 Tax=Legionella sp. W05-934-2 TaxID=1198649 RepID=UPI0034636E2B